MTEGYEFLPGNAFIVIKRGQRVQIEDGRSVILAEDVKVCTNAKPKFLADDKAPLHKDELP